MRPELTLSYDPAMVPIAGKCSACGEQMPPPPSDPRDNVDAVLWLSHQFMIHKQVSHPAPSAAEMVREKAYFAQ